MGTPNTWHAIAWDFQKRRMGWGGGSTFQKISCAPLPTSYLCVGSRSMFSKTPPMSFVSKNWYGRRFSCKTIIIRGAIHWETLETHNLWLIWPGLCKGFTRFPAFPRWFPQGDTVDFIGIKDSKAPKTNVLGSCPQQAHWPRALRKGTGSPKRESNSQEETQQEPIWEE